MERLIRIAEFSCSTEPMAKLICEALENKGFSINYQDMTDWYDVCLPLEQYREIIRSETLSKRTTAKISNIADITEINKAVKDFEEKLNNGYFEIEKPPVDSD